MENDEDANKDKNREDSLVDKFQVCITYLYRECWFNISIKQNIPQLLIHELFLNSSHLFLCESLLEFHWKKYLVKDWNITWNQCFIYPTLLILGSKAKATLWAKYPYLCIYYWNISLHLHHLPLLLPYLSASIHRPIQPPDITLPLLWLYQICPYILPTGENTIGQP